MSKITDCEGVPLNFTEISAYKSPTITYYVATEDKSGYLFRTLDTKETFIDYADRIYRLIEGDSKTLIVLIEKSDSANALKTKAEKYSNSLREANHTKKPFAKRLFSILFMKK